MSDVTANVVFIVSSGMVLNKANPLNSLDCKRISGKICFGKRAFSKATTGDGL